MVVNKINVLLINLFLSLLSFGQTDLGNNIVLPQIFPVSPEAASLGRYGDIPINLATGRVNYTVPLYTIKVKDFEWSIYLSYNYTGLLVEQDPSITGLGWDIISAGRITREIRGIPDERDVSNYKTTTIVPYLEGDFDNLPLDEYRTKQYNIYNNVANKNFDSQFDKYIVTAGDVNGSFLLDEDNKSFFLTHRNYIAEKNMIIDDKGIKYFFEEIELGQYTINVNNENFAIETPVSYLLTKIELPNNTGNIIFEYEPFSWSNIYYKTIWSDTEITGLDNKITHTPTESIVNYRPLKKIIFPNGEIHFKTNQYNDVFTNQHGHFSIMNYSLEEISILSNNNPIIKYEFIYNNILKSKKLLKKIVKSNNGITQPFYEFDYNNDTFLQNNNFDYTAQDFWGYYNGLPAPNLILASREIDPVKTKYGALEKIKYPTGGYTEIEYEQNLVPEDESGLAVECSYSHNANISEKIVTDSPFEEKVIDKIIDLGHSQIVKILISAGVKKGTTSNALGAEAFIEVSAQNGSELCGYSNINNISLMADAENCSDYPNENECWGDLTLNKEITGFAEDGKIHITGFVIAPTGKEAFIEYTVYYEDSQPLTNNKMVGGIRVSKTIDCFKDSDCYTNEYMYSDKGISSGLVLGGTPVFEYSTYHSNEPYDGGTRSGNRNYRSARSKSSFTSYQGTPVLYERVEVLKNGGQNGKTVNYYSKAYDIVPGFPFMPSNKLDWKKGKLLSSDVYAFKDGIYKQVKKITNQYQSFYPFSVGTNNDKNLYGMTVGRNSWRYAFFNGGLIEGEVEDYKEDYNYDTPKEYKLINTKIEEFFDNGSVLTTKSYNYDKPYGQIEEIHITNSKEGTTKQKILYPYSIYSVANNKLMSQNKVSIPIQNQVFNILATDNTELLLNIQSTNYKDWGNNIVLPETIETSKGTGSLEPRLTYHKYNGNGDPLEVSKADGTHIVYVWGYDGSKPIAKIENTIYDHVFIYFDTGSPPPEESATVSEQDLRDYFQTMRGVFTNSQITSYTYDPLIGVTSITDPSGYTSFYVYDDFNRLQYIKDKDGAVLKSYKYHYQGQADPEAIVEYSVTSTTNGNGTVTVPATVNSGDDVPVSIVPNTGYEITSIKVNNVSQPISTSFTIENVTSNLTIDVEFSLISDITVSYVIDGGTGTVSISPSVVSYGGSTTVTLTPHSGYEVEYVKVGTTSYTVTNNTATISNITSDTVVHVKFAALALSVSPTFLSFLEIDGYKTITVTASGSWTVSKSDSWITTSVTTGTGNDTFTVRPLKNLGSYRTGSVTVSNGSTTKIISIEQFGSGGPM